MKKIITYILIIIICLLTAFIINKTNNNTDNLNKIKVAEVTHSAFYTPFYIAIEKGYFKDNGIDIDLILTSGANNVIAAVLSGDVQIGFCGPEATIYVYNEGEKNYIQTFAGLTKKDGQFIVSRKKIDNFSLKDLEGKEVLAGRSGGMPIINFYSALSNQNISNVNINDSIDFANLTSAFIAGNGDFVNLFEPNATKLESLNYGYIVANVGKYSDLVPYTAFNAKKSFIENNPELIKKFRNAIDNGLNYTKENDPKTLANDIINLFPDTSLNDLEIIIKRYKEADSWLDSTYISEDIFKNLEDMLIKSKLIKEYVPYNNLIINE